MTFRPDQIDQLLKPVNPVRVLRDDRNHSHLSQQDVIAHLIRMFGFGNFSTEVVDLQCLFETPRDESERRWDVAYRCTMRLTILKEVADEEGVVRVPSGREMVTSYEDASVGFAQNQNRGDGHDLAMKTAISVAKKRCAIHLGDQFGLSLYNKGQTDALVRGVLGHSPAQGVPVADVQDDVPKQEALGVDETAYEVGDTTREERERRVSHSTGVNPASHPGETGEEQG